MSVEKDHSGRGISKILTIPPVIAVAYWTCQARKGNLRARQLMENIGQNPVPPFEEFAGTYIIYSKANDQALPKLRSRPTRNAESWYVNRLRKELGGEVEVATPAGRIDLLTSKQIIEVKEVKSWKCAIGQVETYGDYYPSHQKRIHLFGSCQEGFYQMIEFHCTKREILLTWEI